MKHLNIMRWVLFKAIVLSHPDDGPCPSSTARYENPSSGQRGFSPQHYIPKFSLISPHRYKSVLAKDSPYPRHHRTLPSSAESILHRAKTAPLQRTLPQASPSTRLHTSPPHTGGRPCVERAMQSAARPPRHGERETLTRAHMRRTSTWR